MDTTENEQQESASKFYYPTLEWFDVALTLLFLSQTTVKPVDQRS